MTRWIRWPKADGADEGPEPPRQYEIAKKEPPGRSHSAEQAVSRNLRRELPRPSGPCRSNCRRSLTDGDYQGALRDRVTVKNAAYGLLAEPTEQLKPPLPFKFTQGLGNVRAATIW